MDYPEKKEKPCPMSNYTFTKKESLISRPESMPEPGPYYTCLVEMKNVPTFPFDYALYFSTDHHRGPGGIYLYLCNGSPANAANWISYDQALAEGAFDHLAEKPAANPIFTDPVQGSGHSETPHVNVIGNTVYMTYHKNGIQNTQATLLATSKDGVTFTRIHGDADSVILSYDPQTDVGDGHTGYFRWGKNPFTGVPATYVGYSLHGGGDDYHSAVWISDDAISWKKWGIFTPIEGFAADPDRMIIWHELDPASIVKLDNGEYAALCCTGNRASGRAARVSEICEIYLADDGKTLTRHSTPLLVRGNTDDTEELASPTSVIFENTRCLLYVGVKGQGGINTVMSATGHLQTSTPTSTPLPRPDRQRHLYHP
jgi:hypothetical protein